MASALNNPPRLICHWTKKRKKRKRNIRWFNSLFNNAVKSKFGRMLKNLIDTFLNKICLISNRNTFRRKLQLRQQLATDYSEKNIIAKYKKTKQKYKSLTCNCRHKMNIPLTTGKCLTNYVVNQATIKTNNKPYIVYLGSTEQHWKQ